MISYLTLSRSMNRRIRVSLLIFVLINAVLVKITDDLRNSGHDKKFQENRPNDLSFLSWGRKVQQDKFQTSLILLLLQYCKKLIQQIKLHQKKRFWKLVEPNYLKFQKTQNNGIN